MSFFYTGIINFDYVKTNPNQALTVNCAVTSDTTTLTPDQVTLEDVNGVSIGDQMQDISSGIFMKVTFIVRPYVPPLFKCVFRFQESQMTSAFISPQYYSKYRHYVFNYNKTLSHFNFGRLATLCEAILDNVE